LEPTLSCTKEFSSEVVSASILRIKNYGFVCDKIELLLHRELPEIAINRAFNIAIQLLQYC